MRAADRITVGDVLRAVEGTSAPFEALTGRRTPADGHDLAELWIEISDAVSSVVDRLTFGDLAARAIERAGGSRAMYYI